MLNKMKIRTKLIGSFILVALIAGVLGIYAIRNLKTMDKCRHPFV